MIELGDPDLEKLILDSTVIRAHQHAAGKRGSRRCRPRSFAWRIWYQDSHRGRWKGRANQTDSHGRTGIRHQAGRGARRGTEALGRDRGQGVRQR
jgi:hypothetical protein